MQLEDFEVLAQIGKGSFGHVYKIRRLSDGQILVWKELNYGKMSEKEKLQLVSEVNILRELKHPNIVKYYDRIIDKTAAKIYIIQEYCEGGDLGLLIKKYKRDKEYFQEDQIWKIFTQVAQALNECHRRKEGKVLHRDLKPTNIFFDSQKNVKLGDFGLSRVLHEESQFAYTHVGTPYYMSPEQINEVKYNEKSDIWSLGCLIYEMASLSPPFEAQNHLALAMKIRQGKFERIPSRYSEELFRAIKWMITVNQNERPCIDDLLQLPQINLRIRETQLRLHAQMIKKREDQLKQMEQQIGQLSESTQDTINQGQSIQSQIVEQKEEEIQNLRANIAEKENEILSLKQEVARMQNEKSQENEQLQKQNMFLQQQLKDLQSQVNNLTTQLKIERKQNREMQQKYEGLQRKQEQNQQVKQFSRETTPEPRQCDIKPSTLSDFKSAGYQTTSTTQLPEIQKNLTKSPSYKDKSPTTTQRKLKEQEPQQMIFNTLATKNNFQKPPQVSKTVKQEFLLQQKPNYGSKPDLLAQYPSENSPENTTPQKINKPLYRDKSFERLGHKETSKERTPRKKDVSQERKTPREISAERREQREESQERKMERQMSGKRELSQENNNQLGYKEDQLRAPMFTQYRRQQDNEGNQDQAETKTSRAKTFEEMKKLLQMKQNKIKKLY